MDLRTLIRLKALSKGKKRKENEDTAAESPETDPAEQTEEPGQEMRS